ncbi:MAG: DUF805 domain-containing protein [Sphingobium sp.]
MSSKVPFIAHFSRLFDFAGREDRSSFWPYAAFVFIFVTVAGMAIFLPIMGHAIHKMQQYAVQHPDQVVIAQGPGYYSISTKSGHPEFVAASAMAKFFAVIFGLAILLYAAAVVRRLHDRGKTGFWGLMPLPFILYSSVQMPRVFSSFSAGAEPSMGLFFSIFFSNLFYIVTLIWLIVILAGPSKRSSE